MNDTLPKIIDYGSIASHTFTSCDSGSPTDHGASGMIPPKDHNDYPLDNFGECSSGHAIS